MADFHKEKRHVNYIPVDVMLPLGVVTMENRIVNMEKLETQLKRLKEEACIDGVMVDVWWGIVESKTPKQYDWTAYKTLFEMIEHLGLKIQAIMSFHECGDNVGDNNNSIPLPEWVHAIGENNPDIFYTDRTNTRNSEYLSLGVDNHEILAGRSAVQIYRDFMNSFKENMASLLEAGVIVSIIVGLGPAGELRYPSYPQKCQRWTFPGIGEFQCYDKYLKKDFKDAAERAGHWDWDLPYEDAGHYNSKPEETAFFRHNGTYTTEKGKFFLEWYSNKLIFHGDQILREANKIFTGLNVDLVAKVSGIHWWYNHHSHAAELAAGYYNLHGRDGYRPIARMLNKRSCILNFTCLEMINSKQRADAFCAPEDLAKMVLSKAWKEGIEVSGENALETYEAEDYDQILRNARLNGVNPDDKPMLRIYSFTYLRLGDTIFQGNNFDKFKKFVRKMHAAQDYYEGEKNWEKLTVEDILDASKPSGRFKWNYET